MAKILDQAKSALGVHSDALKLAGHPIGSTGYGLMGLTWRANPVSQEQAFAAMKTALNHSANFWNGGELYGKPERNSLHLLREYFEKYPGDASKIVISIKGTGPPENPFGWDGSAANTARSIEECLNVLGDTKKLDLWEFARLDTKTPIEVSMREADRFVKEGKLGGVCLSEASAKSIRRAAKITKIHAVEVEFSLWETSILENGIASTCAELDIPIVAYSPLGRGFLTGQIKSPDDFEENDPRKHMPRFQGENFDKNLELVNELEKIAQRKGCTTGQIGIAWVKAQSRKPDMPTFIPIPGATTESRVAENMANVELSDNDVKEVDSLLAAIEIVGHRYPERGQAELFADTPEE